MQKFNNFSRHLLSLFMVTVLVLSLAACGENSGKSEVKYENAAVAGQAILDNGGFEDIGILISRDRDFTGTIFGAEIPDDYVYMSTDDGSADMMGVFICDSADAASELKNAVSVYLDDMKAESDRYQPEEAAKLEEASLESQGNVVALCVSEDGNAASSAVNDVVKYTGTSGDTADESETETTAPVPTIVATGDSEQIDTLVRSGNACFECWYYNSDIAGRYADSVSKISSAMPGNVTVYDMIIPLSSSITLPDELEGKYAFGDQAGSITKIDDLIGSSANHIQIYNTLRTHRDEYIYFRTDHHWTALGAYYAYSEFMNYRGVTPNAISSYESIDFDGFLGEFYTSTKRSQLAETPDTVTAYYPIHNDSITMTVTESSGKEYEWPIISNVSKSDSSLKYSTFAGADNPLIVIENSAVTDGSTCIVIKESFGNALVPFLADHYSKIYVVDYRYYTGNVASLAPSEGKTDLLFANNLSMMQNSYLAGKLEILAGNCK